MEEMDHKSQTRFPELVPLNQAAQLKEKNSGAPVFWFHPGVGGVELYQRIGAKIQRPFYGIKARGWMTNRAPLYGVQAMAAYYVHIIQSIYPDGPYDLGGFSLGGMLAYEVTRQLQELGERVSTIVMVDSFDTKASRTIFHSNKSYWFQAANTALYLEAIQSTTVDQTPIHQSTLDFTLDDTPFWKSLLKLVKMRGVTKKEIQMKRMIEKMALIQQAYEMSRYIITPLLDPTQIPCYFFRNQSGLTMGEMRPFYTAPEDRILADHTNYWSDWEEQIPNFQRIDVESSCHSKILLESKSYESILSFCENLYLA